jgi:hypothetical protein
VDTLPVFLQEFGNGAFLRSWLQQFNMNFTHSKKSCFYLLGFNGLLALAWLTENFFIECSSLGNGMYRNP